MCLHTDLYIMAWRWREFFWKHGGKRKRKGFLGLFCGMEEITPHMHDTNMEGRERTWREGKGKNKGKERKGKELCQDFLVFSQGWRTSGTCMCVYLYFKSRNHDLLKELKELKGIIEQRRRAVSDDLGSKVAS